MVVSIILGIVVVFSLLYLFRSKGQTFSADEKALVARLKQEESKIFADFQTGKEDVIAEYERLKLRVTSLVSLNAKLPTPVILLAAPVAQVAPQAVAPVPVAAAQPVVAVAPVVESAPAAAPVAVDPTVAQTL
jgi:hypothetical protein